MSDRWSKTTLPDGRDLFEETDLEAAQGLTLDEQLRGKLVRQPGRGRRMVIEKTKGPDGTVHKTAVGYGKSAPAPFEFADEGAIARYHAESDIAYSQQSEDDRLARYLSGDLVDYWIPIL